jgi:hypothetical protein
MSDIVKQSANIIPSMPQTSIDKLNMLACEFDAHEQAEIPTQSILHGGMFTRTIHVQAGVGVVGALIRLPSILISNGDVAIIIDGSVKKLSGYHVFAGMPNRKQAVIALSDCMFTMVVRTDAKTIEEAEKEFTEEWEKLIHNSELDEDIITGV